MVPDGESGWQPDGQIPSSSEMLAKSGALSYRNWQGDPHSKESWLEGSLLLRKGVVTLFSQRVSELFLPFRLRTWLTVDTTQEPECGSAVSQAWLQTQGFWKDLFLLHFFSLNMLSSMKLQLL